jgi:hypothetical protein
MLASVASLNNIYVPESCLVVALPFLQVAVACQQFQAKGCALCEFWLYCATGPSLSGCTGIRISCWAGAYPGLTAHFAAANLDPRNNHWLDIYDAGTEAGAPPGFEVLTMPMPWWEVPLEGAAPPDNPVPRMDGSKYQWQLPEEALPVSATTTALKKSAFLLLSASSMDGSWGKK